MARAAYGANRAEYGLGPFIRQKRERLGLSQKELAQQIGRHQPQLADWELHAKDGWLPDLETVRTLAKVLQTPLERVVLSAYSRDLSSGNVSNAAAGAPRLLAAIDDTGYSETAKALMRNCVALIEEQRQPA